MLSDRDQARQFVLNHIMEGYLTTERLDAGQYTALAQQTLTISGQGNNIRVNGRASVGNVNNVASNGVIHEVLSVVVDP